MRGPGAGDGHIPGSSVTVNCYHNHNHGLAITAILDVVYYTASKWESKKDWLRNRENSLKASESRYFVA